MLKRTTSKKPDTNSKIVLNTCYSLSEEKYSKEKAIAELDVQIDLATKLLLKATDVEQRYKLEAKKNNCLEKKDALLKIINEIKNVYIFFYKGQLIYEFAEEFYSFFVELFDTDSDVDPFLLKKLEVLQNQEKKLIKLADCALSLKDVIRELSDYDHNHLEKNIENFFNKIENETKVCYENFLLTHVSLCKKIFELFNELMTGVENRFNLNKLRDFFHIQFVSFPMPIADHFLVGIAAVFAYKILFNFLKCQPIDSSFKTLRVYIKFHVEISNFSMKNSILHEISSVKKKIKNIKYKFDDCLRKDELSKYAVDKYLKLIEVRQKELDSIKFFFKIFFKNKDHMQSLKLLNTLLKKEGEELIYFIKRRTGFDFYFATDKQATYTMQSNKMFIKYFFSCIAKPSAAESLRKNVEYFIGLFEVAVDCAPLDLMTLTNKDLLTLSYLSYFIFIFLELHIELESLENKLIHIKLFLLNISLNLSLDKLNTDIKNLEDKEKEFFEKKIMNKNKFSKCKKALLDDFEFFLGFIKDVILQAEEMYALQLKFSYAYALNKLNFNDETFFASFFNLDEEPIKKITYLIDVKNKFSVRQETINKYLVSEVCAPTGITKTKKASLEKQQFEVKRLGFENLFVPMARIAKDLCMVAEYIEQPEMIIIECNKNARKKNKFPSAIGRIRASAILITQVFHESSHRVLGSKLVNSLEVIKQTLEKTITELHNDEVLNLFKKNIERSFLFMERIQQEIIAVTSQFELHNSEIEKFLENDVLEVPIIPSNFFRCDSVLKKINTILKKESYNLRQKIGCLKNVISVISNMENPVIKKFYSVIYQAEEYKKIFHCIQQQNETLSVAAHSFSDFPVTDENMQTVETENSKPLSKSNKKQVQRKKLITRAENSFLEERDCRLVELKKFREWSTGLEDWKQNRYSHLDNVFNTIENCSFANLNKTATAFFKILDYYTKELLDKHKELKDQLSQLSTYQRWLKLDRVEPIKNFMIYSDQWFSNVLARLEVCRHYLLQSSKTYNAMVGNNSAANVGCMPNFPAHQTINSLLAEYLNYFIIYNKNNSRLLFEEKKLASINEEFIAKILKKDSLMEIEKEAELLSQFNEKLREVNHLNSLVKEAQEKKQKAKEELARVVEPNTLNFYLRRIDPSDMQILTNNSPIRSSYAFAPSNAYFFTYDAANLNLNNIGYKFDMEYHAK